jgi:hypothetical protein
MSIGLAGSRQELSREHISSFFSSNFCNIIFMELILTFPKDTRLWGSVAFKDSDIGFAASAVRRIIIFL